ncbi:hypothetical protein PROFUN_12715 [Planoprotostelium fungivorum]|uniref:SGNH hydrolase-type esterase domain-containing protein n=1 Tax=Planoprotostelium fungivorum TaxID=1890364 RepID=A0A2P6N6E4_9EUKA|nr:hypothetical protein PROFUN_12715 [Planoprotostelium fungivorum]
MRKKVYLFGDSITQFSFCVQDEFSPGWGALVSEQYARKADVINQGYSGYNSRWYLHLIEQIFPEPLSQKESAEVLFATLFLGANDCSRLEDNPRQHVPIDEYEKNLGQIVDSIRKNIREDLPIILISQPAFDEEGWLARDRKDNPNLARSNRSAADAEAYSRAAIRAASSKQCHSLDLYQQMMSQPNWKDLLSDGLHLSRSGNAFVYRSLMQYIKKQVPTAAPGQLKEDFPNWRAVDLEDLKGSIKQLLEVWTAVNTTDISIVSDTQTALRFSRMQLKPKL